MQVRRYNILSKLSHYFSNGYNQVDLFSASTFLLYVILTFLLQGNEYAYLAAKAVCEYPTLFVGTGLTGRCKLVTPPYPSGYQSCKSSLMRALEHSHVLNLLKL